MLKAVVLASGGLDSTVLIHYLVDKGHEIDVLGVNYGQRHRKELDRLVLTCINLSLNMNVANLAELSKLWGDKTALTVDSKTDVPDGHYTDESMKVTVVPNRNMIMMSIAISRAIAIGADKVCYAAHAGDHTIYPDCRPDFFEAMRKASLLADWHHVDIDAPFIDLDKADIVKIGSKIGVDFKNTWSCYKGKEKHCGVCGTCVERKEAFEKARVVDVTDYEA